MTSCTAIIAALPREVADLVRGWERRELGHKVLVYTDGRSVVACAGMGAARASLAVDAAMATMPVTRLISAGLAGACDPKLKVGDLVRASAVIDATTAERCGSEESSHVLVSVNRIVSAAEKARLHAEYGADAVDMEAAAVAQMAQEHGLKFQAIKAISDEAEFAMEGLSRFAGPHGEFREYAFALHAALRPAMWRQVIALGRNSSIAISSLIHALHDELNSDQ
ncbi:MAG TPA: phosphorylase [Acidobacteriaceae bacterium]|nr:phosphorylase [Acidobacteriaceae bacterium]